MTIYIFIHRQECGYTCQGGGASQPDTCMPICGDGRLVPGKETCDDGNIRDDDGCSSKCTIEPGILTVRMYAHMYIYVNHIQATECTQIAGMHRFEHTYIHTCIHAHVHIHIHASRMVM